MSYRRHGPRVAGLAVVAALGAMAFAATAQALTPEFLINGKLALHATVGGVQEGRGTMLVPNLNLEINCEETEVLEGLILSGVLGDGKVLHKGCTALEIAPPLEELPCHISDVGGGSPGSLHITNTQTTIKPIEFPSGDFGALATLGGLFINFLSGTGCPLPLKNTVKGTVCALIVPATNNTVEPLGVTSEAIQKSCGAKVLYGANEAFIDGSGKGFLTGAHTGLTLGVSLQ